MLFRPRARIDTTRCGIGSKEEIPRPTYIWNIIGRLLVSIRRRIWTPRVWTRVQAHAIDKYYGKLGVLALRVIQAFDQMSLVWFSAIGQPAA